MPSVNIVFALRAAISNPGSLGYFRLTPDKSDYRPYEVASHFSGKRVISNDADRFKGFYSYFFLRTNIPFPRRTNRVSVAAVVSRVPP
jgi:hypothetical protein